MEWADQGQKANPVSIPTGLNQQIVAQEITVLPSFLFKLSKATARTRYAPLDLKSVREAWTIIQHLGKPGEFWSTIHPSDDECQDAVDHVQMMQNEIVNDYTGYAKKYAVRYRRQMEQPNSGKG